MIENDIKLNFPATWEKIEKENFSKYRIFSTDFAPCLFAFRTVNNEKTYIITINNYGENIEEMVNELKQNLKAIEERNLLIDNYETALIIPIFYDYMEILGKKAFVNLLKVRNDLNEFVYTFQILMEINNSMFCFASPVFDVIETNALNSVLNNFVIKQLIDVVIKSAIN